MLARSFRSAPAQNAASALLAITNARVGPLPPSAAEEDIIKTQQIPAPGSGHVRVLQLNRPKARNAISTPKVSEGCGEADKAL
jgi:hypothetical protein